MRTENMTTQPNAHSDVIVINGTHFVQGRNNGYLTKIRWGYVLLILYVSVQLPPSGSPAYHIHHFPCHLHSGGCGCCGSLWTETRYRATIA